MIKKSFAVIVGTLMLLSTIFVSASTNDNELMAGPVHNVDTDEYFNEIQTAIDDPDTLDEHTIEVASGTYCENIVIDKSLTLFGENNQTTIIDGCGIDNCVKIEADSVTLSGFSIINSSTYGSAILQRYANNCRIFNIDASFHYFGIYLLYSNNNTIDNNLILNAGSEGVRLVYSNGNLIFNNSVEGAINHGAIYLRWTDNNTINNNTLTNNEGYGISLDQSSYIKVFNNDIFYNEQGIIIEALSNNNLIYHNTFINNNLQAIDNDNNVWDNGYPSGGNYWSDHSNIDQYSGPNQDIPGYDGIVDSPYSFLMDSQDNYPLLCPWGTNITPVDLSISDEYITLSDPDPKFGEEVMIGATVFNAEQGLNATCTLSFYLDNVSAGNLIHQEFNVFVQGGGNTTVFAYWTANIRGSHTIIVVVSDVYPPDSDLSNNTASTQIYVTGKCTVDLSISDNNITFNDNPIIGEPVIIGATVHSDDDLSSLPPGLIYNVDQDRYYLTIMDAIGTASPGDTIEVSAGTYCEHLSIHKALTLKGEDSETTIINGGGAEPGIYVHSKWVNITGFKIINCYSGIKCEYSRYCNISYNIIECLSSGHGIVLVNYATHNIISHNFIYDNNHVGLFLGGGADWNVITHNNISYNHQQGIFGNGGANNNTISHNNIFKNYYGIQFTWAYNNNIINNKIFKNYYSITIGDFEGYGNNEIYHNNIINNTYPPISDGNNIWDDGYPSGGNHHSDWTSPDNYSGPNQDQPGSDGIVDEPRLIWGESPDQDNYPYVTPLNITTGPSINSHSTQHPFNATCTVSFYLDNVSTGNLIHKEFNVTVPIGGNTTVYTNWTPTVTGNHTIIVVVSDVNPEDSDYSNNTASKEVFVESPTVDLSITSEDITLSDLNPQLGETVMIGATVHNQDNNTATGNWSFIAPTVKRPYSEFGLASCGNSILLINGGLCELYHIQTNAWLSAPALGSTNRAIAGTWLDGYAYAIGGRDPPGNYYADVHRIPYNTGGVGGSWEEISPLLIPDAGYAEAYNGKVYFIGGDAVQLYDPSTDQWTIIKNSGIGYQPFRGGSVIIGDRIYIINGWTGHSDSCLYYNITNNVFVYIQHTNIDRLDVAVGEMDGIIYVSGGWLSGNTTAVNTVEAYDPRQNAWHNVSSMLVGRKDHEMIGVGEYLYAISGFSGTPSFPIKSAEKYNPKAPVNGSSLNATCTVSFYLDNVSTGNLIHQEFNVSVLGGGNTTVYTNWTPNVSGNHTIIVVVSDVDPTDRDLSNNTASMEIFIREPLLNVTKTSSVPTAYQGDIITYILDVENTGNCPLTNVYVNDTLPNGLSFLSGVPVPDQIIPEENETTICWIISSLDIGQSVRIVYDAMVTLDKAIYYNPPSATEGDYTYLYPESYGVTPSIFGIESYDYWGDLDRHYNYMIDVRTSDPVYLDIFDPETWGVYDEGPRDCLGDEDPDIWDTTTVFTLIDPNGNETQISFGNESVTDGLWVNAFTLQGEGYYVLDVKTISGEEENGYNLRISHGAVINPVGRMCVNFNTAGPYVLFMQGVPSSLGSFEVCKYDVDVGAQSITYTDPDGIEHIGTVGGNGEWRNDTLPAKEGVWTITYDAGAMDTSMWIFGLSDVVTNEVSASVMGASASTNCSVVVTLKDMALLPSALLGNVQLDSGNGTIFIEIESNEAYYNWTGEEGYYEFFDIIPGEYLVRASCDGYVDYMSSVNIGAGERIQLDITLMLADNQPPAHLNEFPPSEGCSDSLTPTISVDVLDTSGIDTSSIKLYVCGYRVFHTLNSIEDGYTVSYTHEAGFSEGETILCRIVAADPLGNTLDWNWTFTIRHSCDIPLQAGWNLISLPLIQNSNSLEEIFSSIDGVWDIAQCYDATDPIDPWKCYATFKPPSLNDLETVDHTMGIWLHVNDDITLTVYGLPPEDTEISLWAGWNLVGYPANEEGMTVLDLKILTGADMVEGFDPMAEYQTIVLQDDYILRKGEGYWVHVPADTVWIVDW